MTELAWETVREAIAYSCDGFDVVNQTVRLPDGTQTEFDYLTESESVVVVPFRRDGRVVVIEEWRQAVERRNRGLPAGTLDGGEDPEAGVRRELREETGYEAGGIEHLTTVEPTNGFSDSVFHYYVAEDCEAAGDQSLDTDESIEVATTTFDDLLDAVREGRMRDGRSAFGICYYQLFGTDPQYTVGQRL